MALSENEVLVAVEMEWVVSVVKVGNDQVDGLDTRTLVNEFTIRMKSVAVDEIGCILGRECLVIGRESINHSMKTW